MNLLQLKSVCEVADRSLSISDAAQAMFRSQSTLTRQIQELEEELGIEIFTRSRNKVLGVTPGGKELLKLARRIVRDTEALKKLNGPGAAAEQPSLTIAASLTQARYFLPPAVTALKQRLPDLRVHILEGRPPECYAHVQNQQAEVAICSEPAQPCEGMVEIPFCRCSWVAVAPVGHPLLSVGRPLKPADIAAYPLIMIERRYSTRMSVSRAFTDAPVKASIVLSSPNADVCKWYVELGLGVAIIPRVAFEGTRDIRLGAVDVGHLYAPVTVNVVIRKDLKVTEATRALVRELAPAWHACDLDLLFSGAALPPEVQLPVH